MIKFHLYKFEKEVQFQIIEQSKDLTFKLKKVGHYQVSEGNYTFRIGSSTNPQINRDLGNNLLTDPVSDQYRFYVWLRGETEAQNLNVVSLQFTTNKKRDEYYNHFLLAFKELKNKLYD